MSRGKRQLSITEAMDRLKRRNKSGAGRVTQGDIGRGIGVHQNTVARWERSVMLPDDEGTVSKIVALSDHVDDWHLKIGQFMLTSSEPRTSEDPFDSVTYTSAASGDAVKVGARLAHKMDCFTLMVIGSDRNRVLLSGTDKGPFHETLTFTSSGVGKAASLSKGKAVEFFIKFCS